jgi:hypothetical protein
MRLPCRCLEASALTSCVDRAKHMSGSRHHDKHVRRLSPTTHRRDFSEICAMWEPSRSFLPEMQISKGLASVRTRANVTASAVGLGSNARKRTVQSMVVKASRLHRSKWVVPLVRVLLQACFV